MCSTIVFLIPFLMIFLSIGYSKFSSTNSNVKDSHKNMVKKKKNTGRKPLLGCLPQESCWELCPTLRSIVHFIGASLTKCGMNHDLPGYLSNEPIQKIVRTLRCISGTYLATTVSSIVYSKRILFLRIIMRSYKNQDGRTNRNFLHYF